MFLASRAKRSRESRSLANLAARTFSATVRFRRVSRARYTSPIPPAPSALTTSYGPSRVAGVRGTKAEPFYLADGLWRERLRSDIHVERQETGRNAEHLPNLR